jgi:pyridoxamine 5'-phosphate oxidase
VRRARSIAVVVQNAIVDRTELADEPLLQLGTWLELARDSGAAHPETMAVATTSPDGSPSVRMLILRGLDVGLLFFTDRESDKSADLAANPRVAVVFHWLLPVHRQVRVTGQVSDVTVAESDRYWATRPPGVRWNSMASHQSRVVSDRRDLESALERERALVPDEDSIPRPERWSGYRIEPDVVEFWQEGSDRIHDRIRFRRSEDRWITERLSP